MFLLTFTQIEAELAPFEDYANDQLLLEGQAVNEAYKLPVDGENDIPGYGQQ